LNPASAPPHRYGHRFQHADGTSPRGLTCHCTHKAVKKLELELIQTQMAQKPMQQAEVYATVFDSDSPKVNHREDLLDTVYIKPGYFIFPAEQLPSTSIKPHSRGQKLEQMPPEMSLAPVYLTPPCIASALVVNSEPHTGAQPSVRLVVRGPN
jgi:hypothetical protein